jgi:hypothetical protein
MCIRNLFIEILQVIITNLLKLYFFVMLIKKLIWISIIA